jgi:Tfp pilus assembly protein PilX
MTLVILGIVGLVGTRLLVSMSRIWREVPAAQDAAAAEERAERQLRADAWGSPSISLSGASVTLIGPAGPIAWTLAADGTLTRTAPDAATMVYRLRSASWQADGSHVGLAVGGREIALASELERLNRKEPR